MLPNRRLALTILLFCSGLNLCSGAFAEGTLKGYSWTLQCPKNWRPVGNGQCQRQFPVDPQRATPYHRWRFSVNLHNKPLPPMEQVQLSYEEVQPVTYQGRKGYSGQMKAVEEGSLGWASYNYLVATKDGKGYYLLCLSVQPASEFDQARKEFAALIQELTLEK